MAVELDHHIRAWQALERLNARERQLSPESVAQWTRLICNAAARVGPGKRPCDYVPWTAALSEAGLLVMPGPLFTARYVKPKFHEELQNFIWAIARPGWKEPRRDLIEFAISYLEFDVMLFGSGYAKRHLARRLQQSPLTGADIDRIGGVLKRAVINGTGVEEFRAYARLFAALVDRGHLPDLHCWMIESANGAILTLEMADGQERRQMYGAYERLSDIDKRRLERVKWFGLPRYGLPWPDLGPVVAAGKRTREPEQMIRRNAYLMLRALGRRRGEA